MYKSLKYMLLILFFPLITFAQKTNLQFSAASLYGITEKLTGDSICWAIVVSLADRDAATNSFILNSQAQAQLKNFAALHKKVKQAKLNLNQQVKSGAKVFAMNELDSATALVKIYNTDIAEGRFLSLKQTGQKFIEQVGAIEKLISERRTEAIDAKLAQKTGIVDKRKGILGTWQTSYIDDLFASYDGVRTGQASLAQLFFTDGVDVTIDANTTVVIRESHMDKLDQTIKRDIALVNGSVLTKLSAKAKETNTFAFRAGSSESLVKSSKFWASTLQDSKSKLSNYDGTIDLTASNVKVTLQQNQGTVVEKGKPPLPPINLLAAPQLNWTRLDTVIYSEKMNLQWTKIENSVSYMVELCPSKNFDRDIRRIPAKESMLQANGVPMASTFIRLHAVDKYGLRGVDSPIYQIIRTKDTQPPPIQIDGWEMDRKYTANDAVTIKGKTKADAALMVDGKKENIDKDGSFSFRATVTKPETHVKIVATDKSGNTSTRTLSIVPMDVEKVFRIQWRDRIDESTIYPQGESIEAHGNAYPGVKITASVGKQNISVQTNSQGDWAISIKAIKGEKLRLAFESIYDEKTIGIKTWRIE